MNVTRGRTEPAGIEKRQTVPQNGNRTLSVIYLSPIRSWRGPTMFLSMNEAIIMKS